MKSTKILLMTITMSILLGTLFCINAYGVIFDAPVSPYDRTYSSDGSIEYVCTTSQTVTMYLGESFSGELGIQPGLGLNRVSWCNCICSVRNVVSITKDDEYAVGFGFRHSCEFTAVAPGVTEVYLAANSVEFMGMSMDPHGVVNYNRYIIKVLPLGCEIKNNEATITDCYTDFSGEIFIPNEIEGYPVTAIGNYAFSYCHNLTSVSIPSGVKSIGYGAFYHCDNLTSVVMPGSVTNMNWKFDDAVFQGCKKLKTAGPIGGGYDIEFGWTDKIPDNAFRDCGSLTNIDIPNSITSIGDEAFSGCSLASITIPSSVTSIGYSPFGYCKKLKTAGPIGGGYDIEFGWTDKIPDNAFEYCTGLTNVIIPDGITSIGEYSFAYCSDLQSVSMPDSVTSIGYGAFSWCENLVKINIPNAVKSIGSYAFHACKNLTSIIIPGCVTSIESYTFESCTNLSHVVIKYGVTSIGKYAFIDCNNLAIIEIPGSVASIKRGAFYNCSNLKSVIIPNGVTSIESDSFYGCSSLESIIIPISVTRIEVSFGACDSSILNIYYYGTQTEWFRVCDLGSYIYLPSATMHYNYRPNILKEMDIASFKTKKLWIFDVSVSNYENEKAFVYVSIVNSSGDVLSVYKEQLDQNGEAEIDAGILPGGAVAKIFVWDENMHPICKNQDMSIGDVRLSN